MTPVLSKPVRERIRECFHDWSYNGSSCKKCGLTPNPTVSTPKPLVEITEEELQDIFNEGVELGYEQGLNEGFAEGSKNQEKLTDSEILNLIRGKQEPISSVADELYRIRRILKEKMII